MNRFVMLSLVYKDCITIVFSVVACVVLRSPSCIALCCYLCCRCPSQRALSLCRTMYKWPGPTQWGEPVPLPLWATECTMTRSVDSTTPSPCFATGFCSIVRTSTFFAENLNNCNNLYFSQINIGSSLFDDDELTLT